MDALEQYIHEHSTPEEELLHELDRETNLRVVAPRMISGHIQGQLLKMTVEITGARRIFEIGTFTGYSALCLAAGLPTAGNCTHARSTTSSNLWPNRFLTAALTATKSTCT